MGLKRVTKTIPLTGGQQDEAPEFILEPPGMAYTENARFRKLDSSEKTEPHTFIGTSGNSHTLDPFVLHEHDGTLVTVGNNLSVYDGTDWRQTVLDAKPIGLERALSTAGEAGGSNYSWAPFSKYTSGTPDVWTHFGYCVAFERRAHERFDVDVVVIIQRYDLQGVFVDETEVVTADGGNTYGPIVQPVAPIASDAVCRIYFMDDTNFRLYTTFAKDDFTVAIPDGSSVYSALGGIGHQAEYLQDWGGDWPTATFVYHDNRRVGFGSNAWLHSSVKWKQPFNKTYGVLGWQTSAGDVQLQATDSLGLPVLSSITAFDSTSESLNFSLLDVDVDDTFIYVMVAKHDTTAANGDVDVILNRFTKPNIDNTEVKNLVVTHAGTCPQGTIKVHTSGSLVFAYTLIDGNIDKRHDNKEDQIHWGTLGADFSSEFFPGVLRNHRIASNMETDELGFPIMVVQQFGNFSPWVDNGETLAGSFANTFPDIKPVTSVLVRLLAGGKHTVIASFDAGQSKDKDASYAEKNISYGNLYYADGLQDGRGGSWENSHWYGNRNILTIEDFSRVLTAPFNPNTTSGEANWSVLVGESRCNVYRVASDIPIVSQSIGDGFVLNSSLPLWYANGEISELSVLDQPEIIAVEPLGGDADLVLYLTYNASISDKSKVFQVVTGYFDHAGGVHRSAPSFPFYVGNLTADTGGDMINAFLIHVTKPLSFSGGRTPYFAEVYMAEIGDELQLAGVSHFDPSNHDDGVSVHVSVILNPTAADEDLDVVRQSETLYTTGNVLPSDPWPNITYMTTTSRRMFAISASSPGTVFYSKILEENIAPEFSAVLSIALGASKDLTAIGQVDDKVLIFEKDAMHLLYGVGPDNTGANGDFFTERVQSPIGCEDQESLLNTPDGLMFYSSVSQEFHLMSRDLQLINIGRPILDVSEGIDIKAAVLYPEAHEARFYVTGTGSSDWGVDPDTGASIPDRPPRPRYGRSLPGPYPVLVYNYLYKKWSVLTDQNVTAATLYENKPATLSPTWILYRITDTWSDSLSMKWETPWIKVNQLQDYGRFREATFLGKYLSDWKDNGSGLEAGDLKVTVKYDYEGLNGDTDEYLFRANVDFDPNDGERLQFKVRPGRPKCQAIKFLLEEQATTKVDQAEPNYTLGRGFELTSVDLVYMAKGGSSRSFGARRQK